MYKENKLLFIYFRKIIQISKNTENLQIPKNYKSVALVVPVLYKQTKFRYKNLSNIIQLLFHDYKSVLYYIIILFRNFKSPTNA